MPFSWTPRTLVPLVSSPCPLKKGAAPMISGCCFFSSAAVFCQSGIGAPIDSTSACDSTESILSRTSFWKPFITDKTMMRAMTPKAMEAMDMADMTDTNPSLRPLRRDSVYRRPIIHSKGRPDKGLFFTNFIQLNVQAILAVRSNN